MTWKSERDLARRLENIPGSLLEQEDNLGKKFFFV